MLSLTGCGGERPLGQVQFCLTEDNGRPKLEQALKAIARDEGLDYFDWSEVTGSQIESVGAAQDPNIRQSYPVMNIGVRRRDGLGFGGGNIGFPTNQVGFGFTAGKDRDEALALMRRTIVRLSRTWDVHQVTGEKGMLPLDCSQTRSI